MVIKMKVLWLCNSIPSKICEFHGIPATGSGGWVTGMLEGIQAIEKDIEFFICFPWTSNQEISGCKKNIMYEGFHNSNSNPEVFGKIIQSYKPDIVHIFGTEFKHSLDMIKTSKSFGLLDKTIVSIQGLSSIIGNYHYTCGLPAYVITHSTLIDILTKNNVLNAKQRFIDNGQFEIETIRLAKNIIGRTHWDRACVQLINPMAKYYHCNESMRGVFYNNSWDYNKCKKHSVFFSQSYYPVKGLHFAIEAVAMLKEKYPDIHVYACGNDITKSSGFVSRQKRSYYINYLSDMIKKLDLEKNITFCGNLDEKEMCNHYLESNVFVCSSTIENSSNSISEAMLLGMPIIASNVGGTSSLLKHEQEGLLYQHDAPYMLAYYLDYIFTNEDIAIDLGRKAQIRAKKIFNREENAKILLNLYHDLHNKE